MYSKIYLPKIDDIFLIYSCDEWKSTDSMRLLCATTKKRRAAMILHSLLVHENAEYNDGVAESVYDQLVAFRRDFATGDFRLVNDRFKYAYLQIVGNGERL